MNDREPAPGGSGEQGPEPGELDDAREAALLRDLLRVQERHREGGVEPELDDADADPEPET